MLTWLSHNWFTVLQSAGIIASLLFTALSWRVDGRVRRITNLIQMTAHHRDLWSQLYQRPGLARVLEPAADVARNPVTTEESLFAMLLILHLSTAHQAIRHDLLPKPDRLEDDVRAVFALPIMLEVWTQAKPFLDKDFAAFVEACREANEAEVEVGVDSLCR